MIQMKDLLVQYPFMLAPMASLTDVVFRRLLDELGGVGLMVTEMIAAEGIRRRNKKTLAMLKWENFKTPQFIQLFASEAEPFIEAIRFIENETSFAGIDINMGCPANKVIKKGAGAALLRDSLKMGRILTQVSAQCHLPLTVKVRLGFGRINIFEILPVLEQAGVDAVTVHFRLQTDGLRAKARWQYASEVKARTSLTIFGNGDVSTPEMAREKLKIVDGIMIGRGAVINPFIFLQAAGKKSDSSGIREVIQRLVELIEQYHEPERHLSRIKAYARYLFSYRPQSKRMRQLIYQSGDFSELKSILEAEFAR